MTDLVIHLLLRIVTVLVAATLLATAIRRSSASVQALAWTAGLVGALSLPLIAAIAPPMEVGWLPVAPATRLASSSLAMDEVRGDASTAANAYGSETAPGPESPSGSESAGESESAAQVAIITSTVERPDPAAPIVTLPVALLVLWAIGSVLLLARLVTSHFRLGRLAADAIPADDQWRSSVAAVRAELGIARQVGVRISRDVDVPAVAGVFRPVLLLPESSDWSASARRDVTLHELAHVARWDALAQLISQVTCVMYWFIPLVWYAARQAAGLREQACDNVVLSGGTRPSAYADRLLTLSRTPMATQLEPVALAMARRSRMHGRVRGILDPGARRTRLSGSSTAAFMAAVLTAVTIVAIVEPAAASEPTDAIAADVLSLQGAVTTSQAQALPQPDALCSQGSDQTSINRHSDDGEGYWRLTAKGPNCDISVRVEGDPRFNDEFTDVVALGDGGRFEVDARIDGVRRELRLEETDGRITRTWRVDGREREYDAAASAWFARFLIGLDRQTGFAVDVRLPKLLERGGVRAVLGETRHMSSDYVRSVYYTALAKARRMSPAELGSLLDQAAELNSSDFYAAELLKGVAKQGLGDPVVRRSVMQLISGMDSDFHKAESIKATVHAGRPTNDEVALLIGVVGTMDSDFHKAETVKLLMERSELSADQLGEVLSIVSGMSSDFHITGMLSTLVQSGTLDASKRRQYLNATGEIDSDFHRAEALKALLQNGAPAADEMALLMSTITAIDSDHHKGEVLGRLLDIRTLREADLLRVQLAAQTIDSDFNESEILRRIAGHAAATQAVKDAVYDAAGSLSGHYRDEVRRAVRRSDGAA